MIKNVVFFVAILILGSSTFAQDVNIYGRVQDTTGASLDSVIVMLKNHPSFADTTGTDGRYLLTGKITAVLKGCVYGTGPYIRLVGANISFTVSQPTHVAIEVFNTSGKRLTNPFEKMITPGEYRVPVAVGLAAQIVYVRVTCGSEAHVFRMQNVMSLHKEDAVENVERASLFKTSSAEGDILVYSRRMFQTCDYPLSSYSWTRALEVRMHSTKIPWGMRKITGGSFSMGTESTIDSVHNVTVSSFYIDTTEVTQSEYGRLMDRNPAIHSGNWQRPVENITWFDAVLYCNACSKRDGYDTAYQFTSRHDTTTGVCLNLGGVTVDIKKKGYRLPTAAEWEFAYRGGNATTFYWGNDSTKDTISKYAWYLGNVTKDSTTQPVASKKPNGYGLYDMAGNVWEWCTDQYTAYGSQAQTDPFVAPAGVLNLRGGDYLDPPIKISAGFHDGTNIPLGLSASAPATLQLPFFGFRVVVPAQ